MSSIRTVVIVSVSLYLASVLVAAQAATSGRGGAAGRAATARPAPPVPIGSIKELMDSIVDPTADVLFDAVSYDITAAGIEEKMPRTRDEWVEVRRHALLLAEVGNLLKMPGRRVAPAKPVLEFEGDDPAPEDLTPPEIQALIDEDPAAFSHLAEALTDAALLSLKAADAMSADDLFASGDAIDRACETCHLKYWYPKDRKPAVDALSRRKK